MARGTAIASLAAAGISCRGGDPSWCHTSLTDLVPIWDIWKCVGSRAVWAVGARAPVLRFGKQAPTTASYRTLVARWIREIRSQQRWVAALPSAEEFERVWHAGSVAGVQGTGSIGDSRPSRVMKDEEDSAGRWCLQSSLQGLARTRLQLPTGVGLVLPRHRIAGIFVFSKTFVETIAEMWLCAKLWNTVSGTSWRVPISHHGLSLVVEEKQGGKRYSV